MPFSYAVHKELNLVVSTGTDCVSWKEIKASQDHTQTDPTFHPLFDQIIDLRAVTSFDMTTEQVRVLARRAIFSLTSKRALVASSPAIFGVGRMWKMFTDLSDNPSQIRVFYDLSSALMWLGLETLPTPMKSEPKCMKTQQSCPYLFL